VLLFGGAVMCGAVLLFFLIALLMAGRSDDD
jgi:hypothetical protein